jgi:hypothetical protein
MTLCIIGSTLAVQLLTGTKKNNDNAAPLGNCQMHGHETCVSKHVATPPFVQNSSRKSVLESPHSAGSVPAMIQLHSTPLSQRRALAQGILQHTLTIETILVQTQSLKGRSLAPLNGQRTWPKPHNFMFSCAQLCAHVRSQGSRWPEKP